uniref:Uncharacterized protein n=1 Tax=Anguilla anguilla TaxID=7936 RepID=A0A0E9QYY9_ANGAN
MHCFFSVCYVMARSFVVK